jgi:hypothetical protein
MIVQFHPFLLTLLLLVLKRLQSRPVTIVDDEELNAIELNHVISVNG